MADACVRRGLATVLVDPRPFARWPATYGLWRDELAVFPAGTAAATTRTTGAVALSRHRLARGYAVLDNESVRTAVSNPDVEVVRDRALWVRPGVRERTIGLASGRVLSGAVVIDATGSRRVLTGRRHRRRQPAEQTAYGLTVPGDLAGPLLGGEEAVLMDWRPAPGTTLSAPTFLYAVPVPGGGTLLAETCLAGHPAFGPGMLRRRLHARLVTHGIPVEAGRTERVRIALDVPVPMPLPGLTVPFGAAAALVHPATGYSIADTFRLAPRAATAIAASIERGPGVATLAARNAVWPPAARTVHLLRRRGLSALLAMPDELVPEFFEVFFGQSPAAQHAFLSDRCDVSGVMSTMASLFRSARPSLRSVLLGAVPGGGRSPRWAA